MKAVVVEIKNGYAALLQDDGSVIKIKNKNFIIGDVVNLRKTMGRRGRFSAMVAAAAMFFMLIGAGVWAYATPYYYISLDVNPSVVMEVNLFERVIGTDAINEGAALVLDGLNLKHKDIKDAIAHTVQSIKDSGYFDQEGGKILITSAAKKQKKAERLAEKLGEVAEASANRNGINAEVAAQAVGYEMVQIAKANNITPGKLSIAMNVLGMDLNEEGVLDTIKTTSVRDLMADFTAGKKANGKLQEGQKPGKPAENPGLGNAAERKAEQGDNNDENTAVDTPATFNMAPNADELLDNAENRVDVPKVPEVIEVPIGTRP
jgi:hypothetical protein